MTTRFKTLLTLSAMLLPFGLPAVAQTATPAGDTSLHRGRLPVEKDLGRHLDLLARKDRLIKTGGTDLVV